MKLHIFMIALFVGTLPMGSIVSSLADEPAGKNAKSPKTTAKPKTPKKVNSDGGVNDSDGVARGHWKVDCGIPGSCEEGTYVDGKNVEGETDGGMVQ